MRKIEHAVVNINDNKMPAGFRGMKTVLISDLHDNQYGISLEKLMNMIDEITPEYVFFPGDLVTRYEDSDSTQVLEFISRLAKKYTVIFSNGNHETRVNLERTYFGNRYDELMAKLKEYGVIILNNSAVTIKRNSDEIYVYGLEAERDMFRKFFEKNRTEMGEEYMEKVLGKKKGYCILLAHNPNFFERYVEWGADIVLSGHVHGGIIRLPLIGGLISTEYTPFPKYTKGIYEKKGTKMVVSCGLGAHTVKVRINNPAELVEIRF